MEEDGKTPEQKFSVVEFQIFLTYYHTWGCTVFFLEAPLHRGLAGLPKWESSARTGVYFGRSPLHTELVNLVLNTRTGHIPPQYHMVFEYTFSTVERTRKATVPGN